MTTYKELADRLEKFAAGCCIPDDENTPPREAAAILRSLDAQPVAEVSVMGSYHGKPILGCVLSSDSMQVGDKLYAAPVAAQPPSQPVDPVHVINTAIDVMMRRDATIAGVLFDFMGWLTTRKERLCLSSADDASPAVTAITEFAKMRNLSLDNAMVTDWQSVAAQPNEQDGPIADGWVLSVGDGYAGYGVYAHMTEYPEEGAVPVLEIDRAAQASKPLSDEPNMFWNHDDPESPYGSIDEFLNDEWSQNGIAVGDIRRVQRAIRLPDVMVRVTAVSDDGDIDYIVEPVGGIKERG